MDQEGLGSNQEDPGRDEEGRGRNEEGLGRDQEEARKNLGRKQEKIRKPHRYCVRPNFLSSSRKFISINVGRPCGQV